MYLSKVTRVSFRKGENDKGIKELEKGREYDGKDSGFLVFE